MKLQIKTIFQSALGVKSRHLKSGVFLPVVRVSAMEYSPLMNSTGDSHMNIFRDPCLFGVQTNKMRPICAQTCCSVNEPFRACQIDMFAHELMVTDVMRGQSAVIVADGPACSTGAASGASASATTGATAGTGAKHLMRRLLCSTMLRLLRRHLQRLPGRLLRCLMR